MNVCKDTKHNDLIKYNVTEKVHQLFFKQGKKTLRQTKAQIYKKSGKKKKEIETEKEHKWAYKYSAKAFTQWCLVQLDPNYQSTATQPGTEICKVITKKS